MAPFTFVHYDPKPSKNGLQKSSKFTKSLAIDSSSVPVEALQALEGAAGDNNWCQKVVRESVATVQDAQACRVNLVGTQAASIVEKDWFDIGIDDEFPSLARLLSSNYKLESVEERLSVESTGKGNDHALDDNLLGSRASSTHNEPILLHNDDESEDDNNIDSRHTRYIVEGGQQGCDAFDMEHPSILSTRTTHEHGDAIKRRRSNSLPSTSTPRHSSTSLLPCEEDEEGSKELVSDSDPEELRADDICSKRQKLSTPQGRRIVSRNNLSQPSPHVSDNDEDSEDDGTLSISLDARLTNSSRSTPASEITSPTEFEVCPVDTDVDQDWDVREIIGKEDVDGVSYYLVDWHPTLLPGHSLEHAKELVDRFEARIQAQRGVNNKRGGLGSKTKQKASLAAKALSNQQGKRPRGRPRK